MSTLLKLERFSFKPDWTIGRLFVEDKHECYVIEDEIREEKVHGETAIPYGTYKLGTRMSPKFSGQYFWNPAANKPLITAREFLTGKFGKGYTPHELIWVLDVPNYQFILLHWGNTDDDTEGCLIVGNTIGLIGKQEAVLNSRLTYQDLYPRIYPLIKEGGQEIEITKALTV